MHVEGNVGDKVQRRSSLPMLCKVPGATVPLGYAHTSRPGLRPEVLLLCQLPSANLLR
jgi:hypothetical protein